MSMGAFTGTAAAMALQDSISSVPLRLAVAMVIGAVFAAIAGVLIGIPVLRLNGDYLAIVTLAFGEIIKSIFNNFYLGMDADGLHASLLSDTTDLGEGGKLIIAGPMEMCIRDSRTGEQAEAQHRLIHPKGRRHTAHHRQHRRRVGNIIHKGGDQHRSPDNDGIGPVSYTHLDVYKRQVEIIWRYWS